MIIGTERNKQSLNMIFNSREIKSGINNTKTYKEWWNSIDDYLAHMLMKEGYNHNNVYNIGISELRASGEEDKQMSMDEFVDFICHKTGIPYSDRRKIKTNLMKVQSSRRPIKSGKRKSYPEKALEELEEYFDRSADGWTIYTHKLTPEDEIIIGNVCDKYNCDFALGTSHVSIYEM